MVELTGPVVKTGFLKDNAENITITIGQELKIISDMSVEGDAQQIASSIPLSVRLSVGQIFYIGNGELACDVTEIGDVSNTLNFDHIYRISLK